jgi:ABC-type antimicrobial peptide transport system permease subunit
MYRIETRGYSTKVMGDMENTLGEFAGIEKFTYKDDIQGTSIGNLIRDGKESLISFDLQEADTTFLDFFSLQILAGNKQNILHTPNSIVLHESMAKKIGDPITLIGTSVTFENVSYTITGILKDFPRINSEIFHFGDGFIFNKLDGYLQRVHNYWEPKLRVPVYILLKDGISQAEFQKDLDAYHFSFEQKDSDEKEYLYISSIIEIEEDVVFSFVCMLIIALSVLLVALFNYISFQTAQFYNRLKECAIRKVNGSGKWQQLLLFYSEIVIVFILSFILGLLLLNIIIPFAKGLNLILLTMLIDEYTLINLRFYLLVSVITGLVITFLLCIVPVSIIGRSSVRVVLLGISERISKERGRKILLFIQMVILLIFMSATLVIKFQKNKIKENVFHTLSQEEQKKILIFPYDLIRLPDYLEIIIQKLKTSNAFEDISVATYPLYTNDRLFYANIGLEGHEKEDVKEFWVDDNFIDFFKLKILSGRIWDENSPPGAVVVDETFADLFPDHNPIGMTFENHTIIGVVENIQVVKEGNGRFQTKRPVYYCRIDIHRTGEIYIKILPGKEKEAQQVLVQCLQEFLPENMNWRISNLHEKLDENLFMNENYISLFSTLFFVISLILSLLSIYSAIAMNTEKRRKEVAIRKINGARIKDIILLFSKTYLWLWTAACIVVFPLVYYLGNEWISGFNQRMSLDVFFFLGIYLSVLVLIFLTLIFHIMRVARCNPAEVIKME